MEITQKNKNERFVYTTTINDVEATCTIIVNNNAKQGAFVEYNGIKIRKPGAEVMINFNCKASELPEDLSNTIVYMIEFLDECIAKHVVE